MQVADRFHLFENIIEYLKDIFYSEMPNKIFIQNNEILGESPKPLPKETLETWNYDNTPPVDEDKNLINYDDKKHNLDSPQYIR